MVLIVDDNADERRIYAAMLEHHGYYVLVAEDAIEGIRVAHTEKPALILMDVMLPTISGFTATQVLKTTKATAEIPVVCMSLYDWSRAEIQVSGCDRFLAKPLGVERLISLVSEFVDPPSEVL